MEINEVQDALKERDGAIEAQLQSLNTKSQEIDQRLVDLEQRDDDFVALKTGPKFSFMKVVKAITDPKAKLDGLEAEWSQEFAHKSGLTAPQAGYWIPVHTKAVDYGSQSPTAAGSSLVETELRSQSFVDILRQESIVLSLGATELTASGDLDIPKASSGATAYWVSGDLENITESTPNFTTIQLRPKFCSAYVGYSYKMGLQTDGGVEQILMSDMAAQIAAEVDKQAIQGDGTSNKITGILNQTGINTTNWAASPIVPAWGDILELEKLLIDGKVPLHNLHYLTDSTTYKSMKSVTKTTTDSGAGFLADFASGKPMTNGWPLHVSTHVPANTLIIGNFSELLVTSWGAVALAADPYTGFKAGTTYLRAMYPIDLAVRHAVSFGKCT